MSKKILVPGRELTLDCGAVCTVYPVGFLQMEEFASWFGTLLSVTTGVAKPGPDADKAALAARNAAIMARALPYIMNGGLALVAKCVVFEKLGDDEVTMEQMPHYDVAAIAKAWIEETIGEDGKKLQPWTSLISMIGSKKDSLSSMMPSSSSSPTDTAE